MLAVVWADVVYQLYQHVTFCSPQVYVGPSALYEKTKGVSKAGSVVSERTSEWMEVEPGEEKPFDFSSKGKMRHRV